MPFRVIPQRDRKLNRLLKRGGTLQLARAAPLYQPGAPARTVYVVRRGWLRLVSIGAGGEERTVEVIGPGELAGEEGLLGAGTRRTGARAGAPAELTEVDGEDALAALGSSLSSLDAFLSAKLEELTLARALADRRGNGQAARRLARVVLSLAMRLGEGGSRKASIPFRLTHQVLAELSGTHRSTVTTLLNDWIYRDILQRRRGVLTILDPAALGGEAGAAASHTLG